MTPIEWISPEAIALPQLAELHGNNASECRTDQASVQRRLGKSAGEKIDVVDVFVSLFQTCNDLGCYFTRQIFPCPSPFQVAQSAVVVVRTDSVIASSLDIEGGQIHAGERFAFGLEQVIGDFLGDELIHRLHRSAQ